VTWDDVLDTTVLDTTVHGMSVIAAGLPSARSCVGVLRVSAGFADDPLGQEGTAHLTEHVCAITAVRRGVQLAARTESIATRYSARVAPDATAALVQGILSPLRAEIHPAELHEAETQAVLTENARTRDQPKLLMAPAVAARAAPTLDAAIRDTSTQDSMARISRSDIVAFRRRWYRPDRSMLCLVGPDHPAKLLAEADRVVATLAPSCEEGEERRDGQARRGPAQRFQAAGWPDSVIWASATPPVSTDGDLLARHIAVDLLTGSPGLLDAAGSAHGSRPTGQATLPGTRSDFLVVAWSVPGPPPSLAAELHQCLPRLLAAAEGAAALAQARARLRARIAFDQQSPGSLAAMLLRHALGQGPWPDADNVEAAPTDRVIELAAGMLRQASFWRVAEGQLAEAAIQ
jgi:predicted Zn-dependent peptidase